MFRVTSADLVPVQRHVGQNLSYISIFVQNGRLQLDILYMYMFKLNGRLRLDILYMYMFKLNGRLQLDILYMYMFKLNGRLQLDIPYIFVFAQHCCSGDATAQSMHLRYRAGASCNSTASPYVPVHTGAVQDGYRKERSSRGRHENGD